MRIEDGYGYFDINMVGEHSNSTYMGNFKCKALLSPLEQIRADKLYRDLLGQNSHLSSNHVSQLAYALAQLSVRLVEWPPFWENNGLNGGHVKDESVILQVLELSLEAAALYVEEKQKEMIEKQEILANLIRKKKIVPEQESGEEPIESFKEKQKKEEEEGPEMEIEEDEKV